MMSRNDDRKIFIGNLPKDVRTSEVEKLFYKFGNIRHIDLRGFSSGSPYAFLEFDHYRDARDAVRSRDGYNFDGYPLRVEYQRAPRKPRSHYSEDSYYDRPSQRKNQPPQRTNFRAKVSGLPPTGSWQDVKDHVRKAGEVAYANVFNDGTGVIEFFREDDLHRAVREMNKTRFKSHEGETSTIRLSIQGEGSSRSLSSRGRSGSRSLSRSISRSISRSRSRSRDASFSRSYSRSPDDIVNVDNKTTGDTENFNGTVESIGETISDSAVEISKNKE